MMLKQLHQYIKGIMLVRSKSLPGLFSKTIIYFILFIYFFIQSCYCLNQTSGIPQQLKRGI